MLTVTIYINGAPVVCRTLRRVKDPNAAGEAEYHCDDGRFILHNPKDSCVKLAIAALEGVSEP